MSATSFLRVGKAAGSPRSPLDPHPSAPAYGEPTASLSSPRPRPSARSDAGRFGWPFAISAKERELLAAAGMKPCRVLARRPLTLAASHHAWVPSLVGGLLAGGVLAAHGPLAALTGALVAGIALTVGLVAHEAGHLLLARRVRGVTPRILLLRPTGAVAIVEGRFEDARGAALFAAGGPLATLAIVLVYTVAGLLVSTGPYATGLLIPAVLNALLLVVNLLPVAPMDGYALFRSAIWASLGNRAEAERRALVWSGRVLVYGLGISLLVLYGDRRNGILALFFLAMLAVQHHAAARQLTPHRHD